MADDQCIKGPGGRGGGGTFGTVVVGDGCGDRAAAAHVFTLFDIQARFADVVSVDEAIGSLASS